VVWLYSCIGLTSLVARLPGSKLCDVISPRRVYIIFVMFSAVSSMLLPLATNWIRLLCFAIVYGLADGLMAIGAILSCIQTLSPTQKAQGYGFYQLWICIAFLCGPPIGGKLTHVYLSKVSDVMLHVNTGVHGKKDSQVWKCQFAYADLRCVAKRIRQYTHFRRNVQHKIIQCSLGCQTRGKNAKKDLKG